MSRQEIKSSNAFRLKFNIDFFESFFMYIIINNYLYIVNFFEAKKGCTKWNFKHDSCARCKRISVENVWACL
jgi:hypothetical protein